MAGLCLLLGILPGLIAPQLVKAFVPLGMSQGHLVSINSINWMTLSGVGSTATNSGEATPLPVATLAALMVVLAAFALVLQRAFSPQARRPGIPWNCGEPVLVPPVHQYTSGALSYSLRKLFAFVNPQPSAGFVPDYLPSRFVLSHSPANPQQVTEVFRHGYNRLIRTLLEFSDLFGKRTQNGDIRRYLQYVFLADLIIILIYWLTSLFL